MHYDDINPSLEGHNLISFKVPNMPRDIVVHFNKWHLKSNLRAKLFRGKINISLHFMPLLHIDMTQVPKILPQARPVPTCSTQSISLMLMSWRRTVYPKKYAHGFVVLCFVVVMQSFIINSHEVFIHIHQGCFAGTGAIVRLPQCQWSKPDGYGKISQCITTTKHSNAKTMCIFLGIYRKELRTLRVKIIHIKE